MQTKDKRRKKKIDQRRNVLENAMSLLDQTVKSEFNSTLSVQIPQRKSLRLYIIWKHMIQTQQENECGLILPRHSEAQLTKKKHLRKIGKHELRDFLKKRLVNNRKANFTVDEVLEFPTNTSSRLRMRPPPLTQLLNSERLTCPICLEIVVRPLLLQCGHTICLQCFQECSNFSLRCSTCRSDMSSPIQLPFKGLEKVSKIYVSPVTPEGQQFWCREGEFEEWQVKRRVNPLELIPGDLIDFCTIKGWHSAIFKKFFTNSEGELMVKIAMKINGEILVEIELLASSRKLAPHGFFTKCKFKEYRVSNRSQKFIKQAQEIRIESESPLPHFLPPLTLLPFEKNVDRYFSTSTSYNQSNQQEWPLKLFSHSMMELEWDILQ